MKPISFEGRVAIVTGAGRGLGRAHALLLAARGAKVVVNDFGGERDGTGRSSAAAEAVVAEIERAGGEAIASPASVTDFGEVQEMAAAAVERWGRIDVLVNNAGILRDKTFRKMDLADFRAVLEVHLMGAVNCTKAVWEQMVTQNYGRIVMTTSSSGLYGNFGQSNYGAAKMGLVGLMQVLSLEGAKYDIRVNCLAPAATTRMTADLQGNTGSSAFDPAAVSAGVLALTCEDAPNRFILCAGAGAHEAAHVTLTQGVFVGDGGDAPEQVLAKMDRIADRRDEVVPQDGIEQSALERGKWTEANARASASQA